MKKKFLALVISAMTISLVACEKGKTTDDNKDEVTGITENNLVEIKAEVVSGRSDIAIVVARIISLIDFPNDGWHWAEYVLDSVKYKNGGFKMSFPETVPDEYLRTNITEGIPLSDSQAKWGRVTIEAYNSAGKYLGGFFLAGKDWSIEYMYSNRSFTEKGKIEDGLEFDCSYKKGWNVIYTNYWKRTTQKPLNENFKWYLAEATCDIRPL